MTVTPESMTMARIKHKPLPVPSAEDMEAMRKMAAGRATKRTKKTKAVTVTATECERLISDAVMQMGDVDYHLFFAAMLMSNLGKRTFREITRNLQKATEMYSDKQLNLYDVRLTVQEEYGVEIKHEGRKWGLGK